VTETAPPAPGSPLVDTPAAVAALVDELEPVGAIAFDLEFLSQERFTPTLCLIQLAWTDAAGDVSTRLVDPLAIDPAPLVALLADPRRIAIAHGARQDVGLLAVRFGIRPAVMFDTQIAAAFAGLGDQVGYARLVQMLIGEAIDKDSQWTDWDRRPLSARQLRYATADVAHLPVIHAALVERLGARVPWVIAEGSAMIDDAWVAVRAGEADAWRGLGGIRGLDRDGLAALVEIAAWRHRIAVAANRPINHVAQERIVIDLARARPRDASALGKIRGVPKLSDEQRAELLDAIARADQRARTGDVPVVSAGGPPTARAELWSEIILALVAAASDATQIAPRFLATRADAEALARAIDRTGTIDGIDHPLLTTWRRDVVGDRIAAWFRGDVVMRADPSAPIGFRLDTASAE
jgi:ribonuclease D